MSVYVALITAHPSTLRGFNLVSTIRQLAKTEDLITTRIPIFLCPSDPNPVVQNLDEHVEHGAHNITSFLDDDHDEEHGEIWVSRSNYSGVFGSTEIEDSPLRGNGIFFGNS